MNKNELTAEADAKLMAECETEVKADEVKAAQAQAEQRMYTIRNASFGLNRKHVRELQALLKLPRPNQFKRARIAALQAQAKAGAEARLKAVAQLRESVQS